MAQTSILENLWGVSQVEADHSLKNFENPLDKKPDAIILFSEKDSI
jgi:hypothetical protein